MATGQRDWPEFGRAGSPGAGPARGLPGLPVFSVIHGVHEGAGQRVCRRAELAPSGGCRTGLVWSGWRGGGQSVAAAASSAMAVRADDSSAMVFPAVQAASSAVVARRLMARGMPRAQEWMTRTASSENRVSLRPAWARWARRYPSASAAVTAGEGMTQRSWTLWSRAAMSPTRRRLLRVGWPMSRTVSGEPESRLWFVSYLEFQINHVMPRPRLCR